MNNFSPSTDTSVGTKRFTAQEVQLAYTLMAVEYMKTIKGLNPNHQLVDKAVKLKALGFTSRNKARMNAYPFFHILNKAKAHDVNIADSKECSSADLFIAAPIEEMNETMQFTVPERKIIPINNDPFVFQVTPIGVMIHSKWGVEAEDNIFDNIKPL